MGNSNFIVIRMHGTSDLVPDGYLWNKMITISEYPKWAKYVQSVQVGRVEVGATYHDVTTLLWIPIRVEHRIERIKPHEELEVFLPLTKKAKMWHKFKFSSQGKTQIMDFELKFDLGSRWLNATVGRILERRWLNLIRDSFPELDESVRISD